MQRQGFTLIELVMVTLIVGILGVVAVVQFLDFQVEAENSRALGNIGALRVAISNYYAQTAFPQYSSLCTAAGNPYRSVDVPSPCYPVNIAEVESLLVYPIEWGTGGACYDSITGDVISC